MNFWRRVALTLGFAGAIAGTTPQKTVAQQEYNTKLTWLMKIDRNPRPDEYFVINGRLISKQARNIVQEIASHDDNLSRDKAIEKVIEELDPKKQGVIPLTETSKAYGKFLHQKYQH